MGDDLKSRYHKTLKRIKKAVNERQGFSGEVRLLAVSKKQEITKIRELYDLGHRYFGENYGTELISKAEALQDLEILWAYIGQLQSNKIQKIVFWASEIQSVTTLKHIRYISRYAKEFNKAPYPIFINVNVGDEASKTGISWEDAEILQEEIKKRKIV